MRMQARLVGFAVALALVQPAGAAAQAVIGGVTKAQPGRDRVPVVRVGTAVVRGRIVDGTTGAAVARARVTVRGPGIGQPPVTTDATGAFAFTNLPAGPVTLIVDKATFMQAQHPAQGRTLRSRGRPLVLRDGQVLDDVTVPIFHGSAISGRVLDSNGDPVEYAGVGVLRIPASGRAGRPIPRGGAQSNDLGEFRIARLEPGTYMLYVMPRHFQMDQVRPDYPLPPLPAPTPRPLKTFYPGASSIDQGQPITVERGQSISGLDVVLTEGLPAVVTGVVTGLDGQPVSGNGHVSARAIAREGLGGYDGSDTGIRPDGTFRMTIAPGEWLVEARINPPPGTTNHRLQDEVFGSVRISVAGGAEEMTAIAVGRGATATGRIVFEGTSPPPPSPPGEAHVPLHSQDGSCRSGPAIVATDWTFRIEGLFGPCALQPMAIFGRWRVKAVMHNGDNLLDAPYMFHAGQQLRNVQVIVTDKRSDVTFRVADENGQLTREYVALLFPVEKANRSQSVLTFNGPPAELPAVPSRAPVLNGPARATAMIPPPMTRRESLMGVAPGEYYAAAVDDMEPEDPHDPEVLERLASSALRVTVSEGVNQEIAVRRVKLADVMRK